MTRHVTVMGAQLEGLILFSSRI